MNDKNKIVGWKGAWHVYPLENFKKSLWKPFFLEVLCFLGLHFSTISYSQLISTLCSFVNGGYPSIVGFVLSGYALLIGFSNSELIRKMTVKVNGHKSAFFQEVNATFSMMLLWLIITLIMSFLISTIVTSQIDLWGIPSIYLDIANGIIFYVFLFLILYSLFSLFDVVINIFNFGQFAYVVNSKTEEKNEDDENSKIKDFFREILNITADVLQAISRLIKF